MTIFSPKCERCKKINKKKLFICKHCNIFQCERCVNITNCVKIKPVCKEINEIQKIDQCVFHCNKKKNYCNNCGGKYINLRCCNRCKIYFCSFCHDRNMKDIGNIFYRFNDNFFILKKYYCGSSCFEMDLYLKNDIKSICQGCGIIFNDNFFEKKCGKCIQHQSAEKDLEYSRERFKIKKKILKIIEDNRLCISYSENEIKKYLNKEVEKNKFIITNKITFKQWCDDYNEGSNTCMNMFDRAVLSYLEDFHKNKNLYLRQ